MGSGTAAIAALMQNRRYVGYDIDKEYIKTAEKRIKEILEQKKQKKISELVVN
jgi:site-specific DNA-methyltransferase (adenine-specific)